MLVLDQNNPAAGPNGTASLYLNNAAPVTAEIRPLLEQVVDNNNWVGRSQWPDPLFDGLIDELRIYNHALPANEVSQSFMMGPDAVSLPELIVNRDTGAVSISNPSSGNVQVKGYSITSAAGSLNPMTWTSIDATNTFDPNGTWTAQSSTATNLSESVTGGTLDGGRLHRRPRATLARHGSSRLSRILFLALRWETTPPVLVWCNTPAMRAQRLGAATSTGTGP